MGDLFKKHGFKELVYNEVGHNEIGYNEHSATLNKFYINYSSKRRLKQSTYADLCLVCTGLPAFVIFKIF